MNESKRKVLILCTGNSCRSQMAEGLINHDLGDRWRAYSAGTQPSGYVHPLAIRAMAELGIDISDGRSKSTEEFRDMNFDCVITVCDDAAENCPLWLRRGKGDAPIVVHIGFMTRPKAEGDEVARMRRVPPCARRDSPAGWGILGPVLNMM